MVSTVWRVNPALTCFCFVSLPPSLSLSSLSLSPLLAVPIIVIPQAAASLVQMANVYDLLHNGIFVEPAVKKEELKRAKQAIPTEVRRLGWGVSLMLCL